MRIKLPRAVRRAAHWDLWGVLLCGIASALLWEHGFGRFRAHFLLPGLVALPVIGGCLTPEKPWYTVIVFAIGSVPIFGSDFRPVPIGYWPIGWIRGILAAPSGERCEILAALPVALLLFTAVALTAMSILYAPLVYLGWRIRRLVASR